MKKILYISSDGLLDPLGQSQIFPFIKKLSENNLFFYVCTIENTKNFNKAKKFIPEIKKNFNINWNYFFFDKKKGKFNRLIEVFLLYFICIKVIITKKIDIIHCRSYLPMFLCLFVKIFSKKKIIFDTRGSWFDERIEGGMLNNYGFDLFIYKFLKRIEYLLFKISNHIVFLTDRAITIINPNYILNKDYSIIPCAADYDSFKILNRLEKDKIKNELAIKSKFIITYSGSLGSWYNFDLIVNFFKKFYNLETDVKFIILTQSNVNFNNISIPEKIKDSLIFFSADRSNIPKIIGISNLTLCFIKNSKSKLFSSPTKIAESFGCGTPVVCNTDIGDLDKDIKLMEAGFFLNKSNFIDDKDFLRIINGKIDKFQLRNLTFKKYSLVKAIEKYLNIYNKL